MLIQCHSCNTKYRLNLDQIPRRKTFVRCKSCGTPIYIDPTEEDPSFESTIPPHTSGVMAADASTAAGGGAVLASPGSVDPDLVQVVCPNCAARYRVDPGPLQRGGVKLKCTQCGHLFAPPLQVQPPPRPAPELPPFPEPPERTRTEVEDTPELHLPDEQRMERMFDDLRPAHVEQRVGIRPPPGPSYPRDTELGSLPDSDFEHEAPSPDPERAYLDAVAFDAQAEEGASRSSVPETQKYRFFLNPKSFQGSSAENEPMSEEPELPLPGEASPDAPAAPDAAHRAPVPVPAQPASRTRKEMEKLRQVVPGQEARVFTERRVLAIVATAAVLILIGTGAWGYWLAASGGERQPFRVQRGQPHQLALQDELQGRYVTNKASGKRLFVVNGTVENRFGAQEQVRWIRIKGIVYAAAGQQRPLDTSFAYAGNVLEDEQLAAWELSAIKAYYGFTNGRQSLNYAIPPGAAVPYQLVFSDAAEPVASSEAQIVSYHVGGRAVFVDAP